MSYPQTIAEQLAKTAEHERECGDHYTVKAKVARNNGQPALAIEYDFQAGLCFQQAEQAEAALEELK